MWARSSRFPLPQPRLGLNSDSQRLHADFTALSDTNPRDSVFIYGEEFYLTDQSANPKALVEHVAKALVNAPDQVFVDEFNEDGEIVIELEVAEEDMGRVIGKGGKIARAMRNLLHAAGTKADQRYELEILE